MAGIVVGADGHDLAGVVDTVADKQAVVPRREKITEITFTNVTRKRNFIS